MYICIMYNVFILYKTFILNILLILFLVQKFSRVYLGLTIVVVNNFWGYGSPGLTISGLTI